MEAAVAELVETGFQGFSIPAVARRAGVAPSTLRRRWGTSAELILEAVSSLTAGMVPDPCGESLVDDVHALAGSVATMLREPSVVALLRAAFALPEEQLDELRVEFWRARIEVSRAIVDRAIDRGELPVGTRAWDVVEPVLAMIWMRLLITGMPLDDAAIRSSVDRAVAAAKADAAAPVA